jgi:hypothetical protein
MARERFVEFFLDVCDAHGAWFDRSVVHNGKDAVKRSIARYIAAIQGDGTAELQ